MKNVCLMALLLVISCGKIGPSSKSSQHPQKVSAYFSSSQINIRVFYEEGAEPYTDGAYNLKLWQLLQINMDALFQGRSTIIKVPKTLPEMFKIPPHNKTKWSLDQVMELSKSFPTPDQNGVSTFNIFFLNGYSDKGPGVIGFHISDSKVMAVFKDVIKASGTAVVQKYVEQATVIHEMGHALGLVNNGLPMITRHEDSSHKAHCSNENCVMYYANEGTASMMKFALKLSTKTTLEMFDQQCLDDARNFKK